MARILFCTWQYYPVSAGGAERQARLQAEELVRRGHSVTVLCPRSPGAMSGVVDGVQVVRLPRSQKRILGSLTYFAVLFLWVLRRAGSFDVAHVHLANLQADVVVAAGKLRGLPTHLKVANSGTHGETRRLRRIARVTRWYGLRHADSVQALSEETRQELLRIGVPDGHIVRIPNGVPADTDKIGRRESRRALALPDGGIVLFLGRFAQYKGLGDLLEAWPRLRRPEWRLLLVGEEAVDAPFGPMPAAEDVLVHPWTSHPRRYLESADVFVLPSHSEGMSNALLEAMSSGTVVVSSDTGAATEMIEDGISGLIHRTGDVADLADSLDRVMSDPALRSSLAEGARLRSRVFSVEAVVDQLERVYARIGRGT